MAEIKSTKISHGNKNPTSLEGSKEKSSRQSKVTPMRRVHRYKNMLHLWEFLLELLADESCGSIICWRRKDCGEFRLIDQHEVAKRWGILKQREGMNYGKLSRALRLYYEQGIIRKVKGQMLVYKFCKLPYKYEPGVTRSFYQERFKRLNSSLRQSELQTSKPLQPQIISRSLPATSAISPPATPAGKRLSWPVGPIPTPQVCFCSGPVSCSSSLYFYKSRIFYPDSWSSESCGFRPIEPVHSELRQTLVSG